MSPGFTAAVLGALAGIAVVCVIQALVRPAPVNLAAAVAELDEAATRRADGAPPRSRRSTRLERVAGYSARSSSRWWGIPTADLDVLDQTPERYIARRLVWAAGATATVLTVAGLAWFGGIGFPATVVVLAAVIAAVAGSVVPVLAVREDADNSWFHNEVGSLR